MTGVVVGRTSRVAFVRLRDDRLIAVHQPSIPAFPFSWVSARWRNLGLATGTRVTFDGLHLETSVRLVLGRAIPPGAVRASPDMGRKVAAALSGIPEAPSAREASASLARGLRAGTLDGVLETVIGLGPGLTPSGDDVVLGLMAGLAINGDETRSAALRWSLAGLEATLDERTTLVSAAILRAALAGEFAPVLADIAAFADGEPYQLAGATERLRVIGATSGQDMLAGIGLAMCIGGST